MHSHLSVFNRPQISPIPQPKTSVTAYLNAYKLATEKQHLEQELTSLKLRQQKIQKQLAFIHSQVAEIEKGVSQTRSLPSAIFSIEHALTQAPLPAKAIAASTRFGPESQEFETVGLEY